MYPNHTKDPPPPRLTPWGEIKQNIYKGIKTGHMVASRPIKKKNNLEYKDQNDLRYISQYFNKYSF